MALFWRRFTTAGAVASILVGTVSTLVLISLSPTILEDVVGNDSSRFPLKNPALVSMPLAFLVGVVVSLLRPERRAQERFVEVEQQMHLEPAAGRPAVAARPAGQ